jgi:sec-independent protein translocase protein TatA
MGIGGIGIGPLLVILVIVVLLFGTKKLKGMGSDLGGALKGFKKALSEDEKKDAELTTDAVEKKDAELTEAADKKETDKSKS